MTMGSNLIFQANFIMNVALAGFDQFEEGYNTSYADETLPTLQGKYSAEKINKELKQMFDEFCLTNKENMSIEFVTESRFGKEPGGIQ